VIVVVIPADVKVQVRQSFINVEHRLPRHVST
jgi:hypothetical protein